MKRCTWAEQSDIERTYHDTEWGVQLRNEQRLFEFLILEGVQAGLSWRTVLNKREHYRKVYDNFDVEKVAAYDDAKCAALLDDAGIIRNRLKVKMAVTNAKAFIEIQKEFGSFEAYWWGFVDGKAIQNTWEKHADIPATTELSDRISKDMKKRGFTFVGSTIIYAMMQATGLVNDHTTDCFRYKEVQQ